MIANGTCNMCLCPISSALDYGGVSREFFELLCVECFDPSNRLFRRFKDNPQGLVGELHLSLFFNQQELLVCIPLNSDSNLF